MLHFCLRLKYLIGFAVSLLLQSSRSTPQHYQNTKEGDGKHFGNAISNDQTTIVKDEKDESRTVFSDRMHRKLQFDGMFENIQAKGKNLKILIDVCQEQIMCTSCNVILHKESYLICIIRVLYIMYGVHCIL